MWELAAFILLDTALVVEKLLNDRACASFKAIVHVSGTRGKTSTCRLLDAALRARFRVFTKTTGTRARVINTSGEEKTVHRIGPANISEQIRIIRQARRERAEILIIESMAVKPELLSASQELIVRSTHSVITNTRLDHVLDMGMSSGEIERALSAITPRRGTLFIGAEVHGDVSAERCAKLGSALVRCAPDIPGHENESAAREIARSLGITDDEIDAGFAKVRPDFGSRKEFLLRSQSGKSFVFQNLFSVNDPVSTLADMQPQLVGASAAFLFNNRADRPDRAMLFAHTFFPRFPGATVYVVGGAKPLACRLFSGERRDVRPVNSWRDAIAHFGGDTLIGVGNIKGEAYGMIKTLENSPS